MHTARHYMGMRPEGQNNSEEARKEGAFHTSTRPCGRSSGSVTTRQQRQGERRPHKLHGMQGALIGTKLGSVI
ncbi:hypothetical protein SLA2020_453900 [Shorea laevis]